MKTFLLRTCAADGSSSNNFIWPESGPVTCPDWNPRPRCGNGLHGLLMGDGEPTRGAAANPFIAPDVAFVWERGVPIPEAEYEFLIARARWAEEHNRVHPVANPRKPIDLAAMPPVYRRNT